MSDRRTRPQVGKTLPPGRRVAADRRAAKPGTLHPLRRAIAQSVGARVEVSIAVASQTGQSTRPAFGTITALDQVAVTIEGETEPRAFAPSKVKVLP